MPRRFESGAGRAGDVSTAAPSNPPGPLAMDLFDNPDRPQAQTPPLPAIQLQHANAPDPLRRTLLDDSEALDDLQLLTLLLSATTPAHRARLLALQLLSRFRTAPRALSAPVARLRTLTDLDDTQIALLKTVDLLAARHARAELPEIIEPMLNTYDRVIDYCRTLAGQRSTEEFHLLHLDRRNRLIRDECHRRGTVNNVPAHAREVCIAALDAGASALIAVHNHPSGAADPSRADISFTETLRDALNLIGVTLHDHIVVTASEQFSFRAKGLL